MARNLSRPGIMRPGDRFSLFRFFGEVWAELRRVSWPSRQEATRLTVLVLSVSVAFGVFLGFADILFSELFKLLAGT